VSPDASANNVKPGRKPNREAEVFDAAIEVFYTRGYAASTIQDVADKVGVLKGSLYYYIDSKEDLLHRIFTESYEQSVVLLAEANALDAPPLDRLRSYFEAYVLWYLKNVERVSLYFNDWKALTGKRRAEVIEQRAVYEQFITEHIDAAKRDGTVSEKVDTKYAVFFLLGAVNGIPTWYRRQGPDSPEHIAELYADMVIATLLGMSASERNGEAKAGSSKRASARKPTARVKSATTKKAPTPGAARTESV
jgi:TetR/AcrR family transcriptional regulator, cholesterol catabolism regulator